MRKWSLPLLLAVSLLMTRVLLGMQKPGGQAEKRESKLVRLTSNEFIGLNGVVRIVDQPNGAIRVTLATGSSIDLGHSADVEAVRAGMRQLADAGQIQLFEPTVAVMINLAQVTNIFWDDEGMAFWGTDAKAWIHKDPQQYDPTWKRLQARLSDKQALSFVEVLPRKYINLTHVQHVSVVNGELRLLMSNKMWPKIQGEADAKAVREALERASTPAK